VYGADAKTENIYHVVAQELVPRIWAGGVSTLFAYGQTGSGKTYTVTGITNLVVHEMIAMTQIENREFYVCCFELLGKKAYGKEFQ
jgi:kinesin family member 2/24